MTGQREVSELLLLVTEEQRQQQADGEAENGDGSREQTAVNWARRDPRRRGRSRLDRFKTRRGGAGVLWKRTDSGDVLL